MDIFSVLNDRIVSGDEHLRPCDSQYHCDTQYNDDLCYNRDSSMTFVQWLKSNNYAIPQGTLCVFPSQRKAFEYLDKQLELLSPSHGGDTSSGTKEQEEHESSVCKIMRGTHESTGSSTVGKENTFRSVTEGSHFGDSPFQTKNRTQSDTTGRTSSKFIDPHRLRAWAIESTENLLLLGYPSHHSRELPQQHNAQQQTRFFAVMSIDDAARLTEHMHRVKAGCKGCQGHNNSSANTTKPWYANPHLYEVIREGVPCALYFDVERDAGAEYTAPSSTLLAPRNGSGAVMTPEIMNGNDNGTDINRNADNIDADVNEFHEDENFDYDCGLEDAYTRAHVCPIDCAASLRAPFNPSLTHIVLTREVQLFLKEDLGVDLSGSTHSTSNYAEAGCYRMKHTSSSYYRQRQPTSHNVVILESKQGQVLQEQHHLPLVTRHDHDNTNHSYSAQVKFSQHYIFHLVSHAVRQQCATDADDAVACCFPDNITCGLFVHQFVKRMRHIVRAAQHLLDKRKHKIQRSGGKHPKRKRSLADEHDEQGHGAFLGDISESVSRSCAEDDLIRRGREIHGALFYHGHPDKDGDDVINVKVKVSSAVDPHLLHHNYLGDVQSNHLDENHGAPTPQYYMYKARKCLPLRCVIDEAVYTRNRVFRCFHSSKMNKEAVLDLHPRWYQSSFSGRGAIESLVCAPTCDVSHRLLQMQQQHQPPPQRSFMEYFELSLVSYAPSCAAVQDEGGIERALLRFPPRCSNVLISSWDIATPVSSSSSLTDLTVLDASAVATALSAEHLLLNNNWRKENNTSALGRSAGAGGGLSCSHQDYPMTSYILCLISSISPAVPVWKCNTAAVQATVNNHGHAEQAFDSNPVLQSATNSTFEPSMFVDQLRTEEANQSGQIAAPRYRTTNKDVKAFHHPAATTKSEQIDASCRITTRIDQCWEPNPPPKSAEEVRAPGQSDIVCFRIAGRRYCHCIGREHKSNGVYYVVNVSKGTYLQRCFDPDCKQQQQNNQHRYGLMAGDSNFLTPRMLPASAVMELRRKRWGEAAECLDCPVNPARANIKQDQPLVITTGTKTKKTPFKFCQNNVNKDQ